MVEREAYLAALLVSKMEEGLLDPCPIFGDLVSFDWARYRGLVHLVSGGVPCQPFSYAGKRNGVDDPRHLWPHVRDGLEILRPEIVFFENVAGISTAKSPGYHSVLHHVLSDMEGLGFRATAGEFSAAEVGAPHLRKRWFILGLADTLRGGSSDRISEPTHNQTLEHQSPDESTRWPARLGQPQCEWEPPRTTEPGLGRDSDGLPDRLDPYRIDRLRALGNAVVPAVAERAFRSLIDELTA